MLCELQWINSQGDFTPDTNEATCFATSIQSHWNFVAGEQEETIRSFACCAEHEKVLNGLHRDSREILGKGWFSEWRKDSIDMPPFLGFAE